MTFEAVCPHCRTVHALAHDLAGSSLRCRQCGQMFVAKAPDDLPCVEAVDEGAVLRHDQIQADVPRQKASAAQATGEVNRPRRRDRDPGKDSSRSHRSLVIALVAGCAVMALVAVTGVVAFFAYAWLRDRPALLESVVETDLGPWPEPKPLAARGGEQWPEKTVTLHISGVTDENTRDAIQEKLTTLTDLGKYSMSLVGSGDRLTILLAPVTDVDAFSKKIDFGNVRSVKGRVVMVAAKKVDGPPPDADAVTKALYDLQSPGFNRREEATRRLKDMVPVENRRREVARALEPLLSDASFFLRSNAAEALSIWADKESVPVLLKALNNEEARDSIIPILGRLKDERAAEPLAQCLEQFSTQREACEALQAMGPVAEKAVAKRLLHKDRQVREAACEILAVIGTKESLPALEAEAAKNDFFTSDDAKTAIRAIKARK